MGSFSVGVLLVEGASVGALGLVVSLGIIFVGAIGDGATEGGTMIVEVLSKEEQQ